MRVFLSALILLVLVGCNSAPEKLTSEEIQVEFNTDTVQAIVEEVDSMEIDLEEVLDSASMSNSDVLIPQKTSYFKTIYHKDTLNQDSILIIEVYDKTTDSLIQEFVARIDDHVPYSYCAFPLQCLFVQSVSMRFPFTLPCAVSPSFPLPGFE